MPGSLLFPNLIVESKVIKNSQKWGLCKIEAQMMPWQTCIPFQYLILMAQSHFISPHITAI